jgi:hypothetical protein
MNGNKWCVLLFGVLVLLTLDSLCGLEAIAEDVHLHGVMTLDGKIPSEDVERDLLVIEASGDGYNVEIGHLNVDKQGRFNLSLDVPVGKDLIIIPYNVNQLSPTNFLWGFSKFKAKEDVFVKVELSKLSTEKQVVQVVDDVGEPGANVPIACRAGIPLGRQAGDPNWWGWQSAMTDANGFAEINVIRSGIGEYLLRADTRLSNNDDRYIGESEVLGRKFVASSEKEPLLLKVHRMRVSLRVIVKWDEGYSNDAFQPNIGGTMSWHTLMLNNNMRTRTTMDTGGVVRFYNLKPGEYRISFTKLGKQRYNITSGEEVVVIPPKYEKAIERTIKVVPTRLFKVSGVVVDEENKKAVPGARVLCRRNAVITGEDGCFEFEVNEGVEGDLEVHHKEYFRKSFAIELKDDAKPLVAAIKAYPKCYGKIVIGNDKKVAADAKLLFRGTPRSYRAKSNEKGEFSARVAPGVYRLVVKVPAPEPNEVSMKAGSKDVKVYDEAFVMENAEKEFNLESGGIGTAVIEVSQDDASLEVAARGVAFLRWRDGRIMVSEMLDENRCVLSAVEGKYKIIAVANDDTAADVGVIEVEADKVVRTKVKVSK